MLPYLQWIVHTIYMSRTPSTLAVVVVLLLLLLMMMTMTKMIIRLATWPQMFSIQLILSFKVEPRAVCLHVLWQSK